MDNDYIDIVEMKKLGSKLNGDGEIFKCTSSSSSMIQIIGL
jgi:hypothetical protein